MYKKLWMNNSSNDFFHKILLFFQRLNYLIKFFRKHLIILYLQRTSGETVAHCGRNQFVGFFFHRFAGLGEAYNLLTVVLVALFAAEDAEFFHTLNERRNGVCLQKKTASDVVDGLIVLLPKHHQNQILWICDAQCRQHRRVGLRNEPRRRIQTETNLVVEFQFFVHNFYVKC